MGLAFKPNIDDLRESPALYIAQELAKNIDIKVIEPNIEKYNLLTLVSYESGLECDICVYLVAHKEFNPNLIKSEDLDFCGVTG